MKLSIFTREDEKALDFGPMVFFVKADASYNDQSTAILLLLMLLRPTALQQHHRVSSAAEKTNS